MDSSWHHLVISWCHCSSSTLWMVWICTWKLRIWVSFKWYRIKDVILNIIFFNSCAPAWVEPEVRAYAWYILSLGFIIPVSIILLSSTIIVCRVKKVGFFYKAKVLYVRLFSLILKINQIVQLRHFSWQIAEKCIKKTNTNSSIIFYSIRRSKNPWTWTKLLSCRENEKWHFWSYWCSLHLWLLGHHMQQYAC